MIKLSKRLQAVASLVMVSADTTKNNTMADIGTDHGYVPIYLVKNKVCTNAIAMDIGTGPLERAREHIRKYRLEAYIETRQYDGLKALKPGEAETIVIAGMGGNTIMKILKEGKAAACAAGELILQPQSELEEFRRFLDLEGYLILEEDMIYEEHKFYPIIRVTGKADSIPSIGNMQSTGRSLSGLSRIELKYGPRLLERKHPVLKEYLIWQKKQKEKVLVQICENARRENAFREGREKTEDRILEELRDINEALNIL